MKRPSDFKCWQCQDTGRVETRTHFPATKYQRAGTLLSDAPCPRCSPKPSTERRGAEPWVQTTMPDGADEYRAVLARLRCVVRWVAKHPPAGWRVRGMWESAAPGVAFGDSRSGPYLCHRLQRGAETFDLWYVAAWEPLSHELVAATCGGAARVLGVEPDAVIRYVYKGSVET